MAAEGIPIFPAHLDQAVLLWTQTSVTEEGASGTPG